MTLKKGLAALLCSLIATPALAAEYILAVEPNYPPAQAEQVYKPLLDYLAQSTGHTFKLKTATNYHVYWRDLRSGARTDFAFEEAHFTDYRVNRHGFTPLVRVSEGTRYSLMADPSIAEQGITGLIGYRVVSMPAPSMGYLLLGDIYKNPIAQPEIMSVAANWRDGVEMVFSQETEAAMVPNYIAQLYPNLVSVSDSREFTGRALSAGGTVPADVRQAVSEAMLKLHEDDSLYEVLVELGASQFVETNAAEYAGSESLLRGVFGYRPMPKAAAEAEPDVEPEITGGIQVQADD
ncbi:MAG TPA: PhnD/SsuA/transferrin family substrate-binding protein [Arenimonas sp.]|uniref:phosphate/phosphite/phosphonate ABC transporter substrate-binding protein n=1 Tax=Arenimonas sp. TaxID=1872635 RepID=UPI002D807933|nr:PhnD/SsuA/transferrin family substrate-binding protein [Arenimonas sp.]HEU0153767.1 PhnD/SsuA/transferrin family substrate-binding protein [Arenimonas sp.]